MDTRKHIYPLTFNPVLKEYIWGGYNLSQLLGRPVPPDQAIAESWEIAAHHNGTSTVAGGAYDGRPLTWLLTELGEDLVGSYGAWALRRNRFPLLIKILDAAKRLSVQVHPSDEYALAHEGNELGKTEMWVVLHAEPGAAVILGLKKPASPEILRKALEQGELESYLHRIPVKAGDHICVPAGSLHAILNGVLLAEIQQNSDTTYRVFDWNRVDKDGRSRPLHVQQAIDVINFDQIAPALPPPELILQEDGIVQQRLCANNYFHVERLLIEPERSYSGRCDGTTLEIWGVTSGHARLAAGPYTLDLPGVSFVLLPAALGSFTVTAMQAPCTLLRAYLPPASL